MAFLEKYLANTAWNNRLIQRTLRDIDTKDCIEAMMDLDEPSRAAIERNMSKRAAIALREDLAAQHGQIHEVRIEASRSLFLRRLAMYERYEELGKQVPAEWNPRAASSRDWYDNLLYLAGRRADADFTSLQEVLAQSDHRLLRLALHSLIESADPLEARGKLEQLEASLLDDYRRQLRLMVEAVDSMLNYDMPGQTAEKLACLLVEV